METEQNPTKTIKFKIVDILLLLGAILPLLLLIVLKVLYTVPGDGVNLTGAMIYFEIPMPLQPLYITEATVNSAAVIVVIFFLCLYLTHGLSEKPYTKRQLLVEWIVEKVKGLVNDSMGKAFEIFAPFIAAILSLSALSSLLSLLGLYPATSDLNITAGWAILVFILITYYKLKCGPLHYAKGFLEPVAILAPINFVSEFATPVSMAFRHYGNILSGVVVSQLTAYALKGLSSMVLWFTDIPFLQIGIPGILSIYFDVFSGCLQAFIFATLTMMYISNAFDSDEFERRRLRKLQKKK